MPNSIITQTRIADLGGHRIHGIEGSFGEWKLALDLKRPFEFGPFNHHSVNLLMYAAVACFLPPVIIFFKCEPNASYPDTNGRYLI